jgi:hypothetical protein
MKRFVFVFEAAISGSAGKIDRNIWEGLAYAFSCPRASKCGGACL